MQKKNTDKHRCWRCGAPSHAVLTEENGVYKYEYAPETNPGLSGEDIFPELASMPEDARIPKTLSTGEAVCVPCRWICPTTGIIAWHWMVDEFWGESYEDGEYVNPRTSADTPDKLIAPPEEDED